MKVLLIQPEVRLDDKPFDFPFWAGIFASIVEKKGGQVAILDLNAIRMKYDGDFVPMDIIRNEIGTENWDLIGVGGLTTMYRRIKQLIQFTRKLFPETTIVSGGHLTSALKKYGLEKKITHISTAGGALVRYLTGIKLPMIKSLEESAEKYRSTTKNHN